MVLKYPGGDFLQAPVVTIGLSLTVFAVLRLVRD